MKEFITKQEIADELGISLNVLTIVSRLKQYKMPNVFKRIKSNGAANPMSFYIRRDIEDWYPYIKERLADRPVKEPDRQIEYTAKNLVGDGKTLMEWVLCNKENEARYMKRQKIYAIRGVYKRMGYVYDRDKHHLTRVSKDNDAN